MKSIHYKISLIAFLIINSSSANAAKAIDLSQVSPQFLDSYLTPNKKLSASPVTIKSIKSETDTRNTQHTRIKQMYAGLPVWGGDAVIHTSQNKTKSLSTLLNGNKTTVNGMFYLNLEKDLADSCLPNPSQQNKALAAVKNAYQLTSLTPFIYSNESTQALIYLTEDHKAHYAYKVQFSAKNNTSQQSYLPTAIVDALTLKIYKLWDSINTFSEQPVESIGGNPISGKLFYDGAPTHLEKLAMYVDETQNQCLFENDHVIIKRALTTDMDLDLFPNIVAPCHVVNGSLKLDFHDKESYQGADGYNGAYSPASDTFFAIKKTQDLYKSWYSIPAYLDENGKEAKLTVFLHSKSQPNSINNWVNASFNSKTQIFYIGDGNKEAYPFSSHETLAHELSHGFTFQHSGLEYFDQSGGMNEAFSDMASKALEFMLSGKNTWTIGAEDMKNGQPYRYMDNPKQDGNSIDNMKDYRPGISVHNSSGVYNKVFYLLSTTPGWNTKKAFDIMVNANRYYWLPLDTFQQAACGVISSTHALKYNTQDVINAFAKVGIDANSCQMKNIIPAIPHCPISSPDETVTKNQLPCLLQADQNNADNAIFMPIISNNSNLTLTNYSENNLTIEVLYYQGCGEKTKRQKVNLELNLNPLEKKTLNLQTSCTYDYMKNKGIAGYVFGLITLASFPDLNISSKQQVVISYE